MRIFYIRVIIIFLVLLNCCCRSTSTELNVRLIKDSFIDNNIKDIEDADNNIIVKMNFDTLRCNQKLDYNQAITFLTNKFRQIDGTAENESSKKYMKALLLSEFVYASFSFQFLGPKFGKTNHCNSIKNWDKLPLAICFNIGNNNLTPVWCGDRTSFYIRLLDTLLGIKATTISIKNVHTFPLVYINDRRYIIDPFDPLIVFDSLVSKIVDYDEVLKIGLSNNNSLKILRTKRSFGEANELVSNSLTYHILAVSGNINQDFSQKFQNYLKLNKSTFIKSISKCSFELYNKTGIMYQSGLKDDRYIIHFKNNLKNHPMNLNHFRMYYLGINCK